MDELQKIWICGGGDISELQYVQLNGEDPCVPSTFLIGKAAQTSIAAAGLAAALIFKFRTGHMQRVNVDTRHALAEFRSERYLTVNGQGPTSLWDPLAGVYRTGDQRYVRVHTNFKHHRENLVKLLHCEDTRASVQNALLKWNADDFDAQAHASGCVVAVMRSREQWNQHAQCVAVASLPVVEIVKIGEAAPIPFKTECSRPLDGIRVLDLTRIIAGPVGCRTLAAHGAEVMRIGAAHLPQIDWLVKDTGRGKLSAEIDLRTVDGKQQLMELLKTTDIFVQAYRPGGIDSLGFSPEHVAQIKPGIVYVSLSAYGHIGPWKDRRGFDSLVQTATGFNHAEAEALHQDAPKELPCQALDHATGIFFSCSSSEFTRTSASIWSNDGEAATGTRRR